MLKSETRTIFVNESRVVKLDGSLCGLGDPYESAWDCTGPMCATVEEALKQHSILLGLNTGIIDMKEFPMPTSKELVKFALSVTAQLHDSGYKEEFRVIERVETLNSSESTQGGITTLVESLVWVDKPLDVGAYTKENSERLNKEHQ